MPAKPKYNSEVHDKWAWSLAVRGCTEQEIADAMGVSRMTIFRWKKASDTFREAVETAKDAADAQVEKSLYKRALGYDYEEKESIVETDRDGNIKPIKVKSVTKHVPPDTMAIMYWLNNRFKANGGRWSTATNLNISGSLTKGPDLSGLTDEELEALAKKLVEEDEQNND